MSQSYAKVYVLVFAMIMAYPYACAQTHKEGTLAGTVYDPQGVIVPNAHIVLRWNYTGEPMCWNDDHCKKTKRPRKKTLEVLAQSGDFSVELSPGVWDVFAYRDVFVPTCAQVFVDAGKTTTVKLRFPGVAPHSQE